MLFIKQVYCSHAGTLIAGLTFVGAVAVGGALGLLLVEAAGTLSAGLTIVGALAVGGAMSLRIDAEGNDGGNHESKSHYNY